MEEVKSEDLEEELNIDEGLQLLKEEALDESPKQIYFEEEKPVEVVEEVGNQFSFLSLAD